MQISINNYYKRYTCIVLLLFPLFTYTQGTISIINQLTSYTTKDGLPTNEIYNSLLDAKGYLWFGSDKGAVRYNGIRFETFDVKNGLPTNDILGFAEDKHGRIWLATYLGNLCYYKNGIFHTEKNTAWLQQNVPNSFISTITTTGDGNILIAFANRNNTYLEIIDNTIKKIELKIDSSFSKLIKRPNANLAAKPFSILELFFQNYRLQVDATGNILQKTAYPTTTPFVGNKGVYRIQEDGNCYDQNNNWKLKVPNTIPLSNTIFFSYFETAESFFLCSNKGLFIISIKTGLLQEHITSIIVHYIVQDFEGNFWFSTNQKGIYKLSANYKEITVIPTPKMAKPELVKLDNQLFILDKNRFFIIDSTNSIKNNYYIHKGITNYYIAKDKIILRNEQQEIYTIDRKENAYRLTQQKTTPLAFQYNKHSTTQGDYYFNWMPRKKIYYVSSDTPKDTLVKNLEQKCYSYDFDAAQEQLIIANPLGLYKLKKNSFTKITLQQNAIPYQLKIVGNKLVAIDQEGKIHILSNYDQPFCNDAILRINYHFDKILFANDSFFIASSGNYIFLINIHTYQCQRLPDFFSNERIFDALVENEKIYLARENDIIVVQKEVLFNKKNNVHLLLEKITVNNQDFYSSTLNIAYKKDQEVKLIIDALSYNTNKVYYEYQLMHNESTPNEWKAVETNFLTLLNPRFGTYTVYFRAHDNDGNFSSTIKCVVTIRKPYWATIWFISIIAATLLFILYTMYKYFVKQQLRKKTKEFEIEKKIMKSEYKALNAMMNPHFIFNSLNTIQSLVNQQKADKANTYLSIFSVLMRQNMHNIQDGIISLQKELTLVENYIHIEKLRHSNSFTYTLEVSDSIDIEQIKLPPLLIQPIVENAILHGLLPSNKQHKYVLIRLQETDDELKIIIEDNGLGYNANAANKNSMALKNIEERIAHLSSIYDIHIEIRIESLLPYTTETGTRVTLTIQ
jgi:two-component sensor histidine kinase